MPAAPRPTASVRVRRSDAPLARAASSWRWLGRARVFSASRSDMGQLLRGGLLPQQGPDVVAVCGELRSRPDVDIVGVRAVEVDGHDLADAPGTTRHDRDPLAQEHGLLDV